LLTRIAQGIVDGQKEFCSRGVATYVIARTASAAPQDAAGFVGDQYRCAGLSAIEAQIVACQEFILMPGNRRRPA